MNLLILLVVIIVIAILVGLFYKYKLGGNKDEEDAIDRLCLETGWIRYEPGSKLLCHPDDKKLITEHDESNDDKYNINEYQPVYFKCNKIIRMFYVTNCLKNYDRYKNTIRNINIMILLCKFFTEHEIYNGVKYTMGHFIISDDDTEYSDDIELFDTISGRNIIILKYRRENKIGHKYDTRIDLLDDNTCKYHEYECTEYDSFEELLKDLKIPLEYFTKPKIALSKYQIAEQDKAYEELKERSDDYIDDNKEDALS